MDEVFRLTRLSPVESPSQQDWKARHLSPLLHDALGYHLHVYGWRTELCWFDYGSLLSWFR